MPDAPQYWFVAPVQLFKLVLEIVEIPHRPKELSHLQPFLGLINAIKLCFRLFQFILLLERWSKDTIRHVKAFETEHVSLSTWIDMK